MNKGVKPISVIVDISTMCQARPGHRERQIINNYVEPTVCPMLLSAVGTTQAGGQGVPRRSSCSKGALREGFIEKVKSSVWKIYPTARVGFPRG